MANKSYHMANDGSVEDVTWIRTPQGILIKFMVRDVEQDVGLTVGKWTISAL